MSSITDKLNELIFLSRAVGADPAYAQGAGGNTSIKLDNRVMAVKASGCLLKDMSLTKGIALVDYVHVREHLHADINEDEFNTRVNSAVIQSPLMLPQRPSIETSLHAALNASVVIHSHSVYANVLACAADGADRARTILGGVTWVDYATPGRDLIRAIQSVFDKNGVTDVILCENHGLIVTGPNTDDALVRHEEVNRKIRDALNLDTFTPDFPPVNTTDMRKNVLFPDQVVYTISDAYINTPGGRETLAAYAYITQALDARKIPARTIPPEIAKIIENMESEKYRQSLIQRPS